MEHQIQHQTHLEKRQAKVPRLTQNYRRKREEGKELGGSLFLRRHAEERYKIPNLSPYVDSHVTA